MRWHFNIDINKKMLFSENLLYSIVWIAVFLVPILNSALLADEYNINNILISWIKISPYFIVFAIHNTFIARQLLLRKRYVAYLLTTVALLGIVFGSVELYETYVEGRLFGTVTISEFVPRYQASITDLEWYWTILLAIFMLGAHDGIILIFKSISDERRIEVLKRQSLQAEMEYLKYQINPHFFMNTLNNIHALIDIDTECAKDCVIELSKMMRYVLYESGAHEISLQNELTFVSNYINLMKIRYTDDIDIVFDHPQRGTSRIFVPPLLFIVFVENAFKHGISYARPSYIHISVSCNKREVHFDIENSRHRQNAPKKAGIGLENVKKRLDLIYGKDYTLEIDDSSADSYRVKLTIPVAK